MHPKALLCEHCYTVPSKVVGPQNAAPRSVVLRMHTDDLAGRAGAARARLRTDASALAIGLDWQHRTGCGVNYTQDPGPCLTAKPALIPRRSSVIFTVAARPGWSPDWQSLPSGLVSATVDFTQARGTATWPKGPC